MKEKHVLATIPDGKIAASDNCKLHWGEGKKTVKTQSEPAFGWVIYRCGWFTKGQLSKRMVFQDVPPERKPERGYIRTSPRNENRNEGTFACSPGTKTRTTLTLQSLLFSISLFFCFPSFLTFLFVFPSVSKDFRGSAKRNTPAFFGVSLAFFSPPKKHWLGGQGCLHSPTPLFYETALLSPLELGKPKTNP